MTEFLAVAGKAAYVIFIIGSVLFGISIAVNVYAQSVIRRLMKSTEQNFAKIESAEDKAVCVAAIDRFKEKFLNGAEINAKNKKIKKRNKIRQLFKKPAVNLLPPPDYKGYCKELLQSVSAPFLDYDKKERGYLSLTEREIFAILEELKTRLKDILDSSGVPWLKTVKISFLAQCLSVYGAFEKVKGKPLITLAFALTDFFLWFSRLFSPAGVGKYIVKNAFGGSLSSLVVCALSEIAGKEVAAIYYRKSLLKKSSKAKTDVA